MSVLLLIVVAALVAALLGTMTSRPAAARIPVRVVRQRITRRR
jgi:hypothetical protein